MPSPPQGPNDRRFNAEPSTELPDVHAATLPAPSGPPPLLLSRRKAQAHSAPPPPATAQWERAAPVTAPWPTPPSARAPHLENAEASTPFNSAVDIFEEDARATETPEPDPDFRAAKNPWWRRLKAPSRQLRMGALIAALAGAVGWSAGAKPWASSNRTTSKVQAAKAGGNQAGKRAPAARGPQANANRRVALNAKSKPAPVAPAHPPKAVAKPVAAAAKPGVATKPAATKPLANPAPRATAKTTANKATAKATAKAKAKPTTPAKKSAVATKTKSVSAATKAKAPPAN